MSNVDRIALLEYKIDVALKQMAQQDEIIKVMAGWMVGNARYLAGVVKIEQAQKPEGESANVEENKEVVKEAPETVAQEPVKEEGQPDKEVK